MINMIKPTYIFNKPNGDTISCYGECIPENNYDLVCDDWDNDGTWCGDGIHEITTWKRLCQYLHDNYSNDIVQIEAV